LPTRPGLKQIAVLLLLSAGAILVHGYHPYVEDAEIYAPGIKKALHSALYPHNDSFFASHARLTLFPNLIAGSIRITHLPVDWALLLWHFFSIFMLLLGCWHIGRLCFASPRAQWGGVALVAALLTIPVAGTALYIMDQYLNTRSLSTPAVLFIIINVVERKFWRAGLWGIFTAGIHPLMSVFGLSYVVILLGIKGRESWPVPLNVLFVLPFGLFPPVTQAYREAMNSHSYFFLLRWEWYEWVGIFAPMALLWWFQQIARKQNLRVLGWLCRALVVFGLFYFVMGLVITIPPGLANLAELQPMRGLHLLYILLFVFGGGLLAEFVLRDQAWKWLLLFVPLCAGMFDAQRQLFPATSHLEWPGSTPKNDWVRAFLWIRINTPVDAYFALDPNHMQLPGEDQHGFRAIAERSMLADRLKDSGAVTMFPLLAETWRQQVRAQSGWRDFQARDFQRLKEEFGVNWVVLQRPGVADLSCPYQNDVLLVCRIE
jgi:hypothetical protein